jgi:hypothetical protein
VEVWRRQLVDAQTDIERNAVREIRKGAWAVEARLREIAVARDRQAIWQERVAALVQKRQVDGVTAFDISSAPLE